MERPLCCRLRRCKSDGTKERESVGKRISEEKESAAKEEGVTKVRAREDVSGRISSHSSDRGRTVRPPRPFSISLLRHSSTAAFNDRAVEKGRGTPARSFLLLPHSSFRRARQKATNGADSERKECSRRLNWLGNGWFIARFSTADPQSATPPARERHEKVRDSPTAFSHAREWIMYLYPADAPRTRWSRVNASKRNRAKRGVRRLEYTILFKRPIMVFNPS